MYRMSAEGSNERMINVHFLYIIIINYYFAAGS